MQLVSAIAASTGVADAGKIIETDSNGLIDPSFIPANTGRAVKENLTAGAALSAGDFVYIDGAGEVQLADNGSITTAATAFVLQAYTSGATDVAVYFEGVNDQITATAGDQYFLGSAGAITATPPAFAVGDVCQFLGNACGTDELEVEIDQPVEYATQ